MTGPQVDLQAVIEVAQRAVEGVDLGDGRRAFVLPGREDSLTVVQPPQESTLPEPRRPSGVTSLLDVESFAALWDKYATPTSELYADQGRSQFVGVINADGDAASAGWRDHRLQLDLQLTQAWQAWAANDGRLLAQELFAEFIEDRALDVAVPSAAQFLEIASSLQAHTKVDFKSAVRLDSGQRGLTFEETTTAKAGQKGELAIPATFKLGLQPFEAVDVYAVTARFRFRIRDGVLSIGYKLERPDLVLKAAFNDLREKVEQATGARSLLGSAPAVTAPRH